MRLMSLDFLETVFHYILPVISIIVYLAKICCHAERIGSLADFRVVQPRAPMTHSGIRNHENHGGGDD